MPKPHRGESKDAFVSRCMGDAEAAQSFPRTDQRLAFCHNTYAAHVQHAVQSIAVDVAAVTVRTESFLGRAFRVVPAVLVRSQILRNNLGKTFLPAEDITDEWADQWNGVPVLVGDHPRTNGVASTGRHPGIWDARCVGWIFNARAEAGADGRRRLSGEVWLDEARAAVPGFQAVLARVAAGQPVELSTGFSTQPEPTPGTFEGEAYDLVMHPLAPDHLVISSEMTGACSTRDGCGLGANCKCGGNCQHTEITMATDGAAGSGGTAGTGSEQPPVKPAARLTKIMQRVAELFGARAEPRAFTREDHAAFAAQRELDVFNEAYYSDEERAGMLRDQLQRQFGDADRNVVVTAVFGDQKRVVFWMQTPMGPSPKGAEFFQTEWTEGEQGSMNFAEPTRVRRMTTYEPVAANAGVEAQQAATGAAGTDQPHNGEDAPMDSIKEVLEALSKLSGQVEATNAKVDAVATKVKELESSDVTVMGLKKAVGQLAAQVEKQAGVAQQAIQERERERQSLIQSLAGNYRCAFNEAELEGKPIEDLRKLAEMVAAENFAGRGGPQGGGAGGEKQFVATKPYWETDGADKGKK